MPDRALQEKVSAYADGELDPIEVRQVEAAIASHPELRVFLERTRTLDRRGAKALNKITPKLDETAAQAAWKAIESRLGQTSAEGASDGALFWAEKASELNDVPKVDDKKWDSVWSGVKLQTAQMQPETKEVPARAKKAVSKPTHNVVQGNFSVSQSAVRRWTYWTISVSAAAAVMLVAGMVWLKNISQPVPPLPESSVAAASEVLDNKYYMLVKAVPGVETPVVCFYLKDEEPEKEKDLFE